MGTASYSEEENIFPNRPHWLENAVDFVSARNVPPICWCPTSTLPDENLCQACRDIRLRHLIFCEAEGRMVNLDKLEIIMKRTECDLCSLITLSCKQILGERDRFGRLLGTQSNCHIEALDVHKQQSKGYALTISVDWQWVELELIYKGKDSTVKPTERILEAHPKANVDLLKSMLETCDQEHPTCKEAIRSGTPSRMCIIDLENMNIVSAPQNCRYCALSYVWGKITEKWLTLTQQNVVSLRKKDSLLDAHLPQTIRDAMQLCRDLGERFLWVDSLCIVQNDPIFQKQQIDIMDEIYACASFTIIAAAGDHANSGLPGLSSWLRDVQRHIITIQDVEVSNAPPRLADTAERSIWNSRGWTYQERMFSQRAIFFTEVQAFFACSQGVQGEMRTRLLPETYGFERFQNLANKTTLITAYTRSVTEYTLRCLTNQADILRAFVGVANDLSRTFKQKFFYGLPASEFEAALLWQQVGEATVRQIPSVVLPSWSWASNQGGIKYTFMEHILSQTTTEPIPAFWREEEGLDFMSIDWLLNVDGAELIHIKTSKTLADRQGSTPLLPLDEDGNVPPKELVIIALQKTGSLLFLSQSSSLLLKNHVPFVTNDSWWTDYTTDVNLSSISMISIFSQSDDSEPIGFMEMDKKWAEKNLSSVDGNRKWEFVALSVATTNKDDYMHRHFTMRRNYDYSMLWTRNVRELIVNVMLVEWKDHIATRLGIGKIYLDHWERERPQTKWIVLS